MVCTAPEKYVEGSKTDTLRVKNGVVIGTQKSM
jgi:hypothetical protein